MNDTKNYTIINNEIHFKDTESALKILNYLDKLSKDDLGAWEKGNNFYSLRMSYSDTTNLTYKYSETEESLPETYRVHDPSMASIYNSNGILVIGDSIYKLINEYLFIVPNKKRDQIDGLTNNPDNYDSNICRRIVRCRTLPLKQNNDSVSFRAFSLKETVSPLYRITSKRTEQVIMGVVVEQSFMFCRIVVYMRGRAKKYSWPFWSQWFDDEMVQADFYANSIFYDWGSSLNGVWYDNMVTGLQNHGTNIWEIRDYFDQQYCAGLNLTSVNIDFNYQKNAITPYVTQALVFAQ